MGVGALRQRAVFLDRDGVVNEAVVRNGKPYPPENATDLRIVPNAGQALGQLRREGFKLIVVTNQPDLRRGSRSLSDVEGINARLAAELPLDAIVVCPHDDADACACRKPKPGMILSSAQIHDVDLSRSYLIGDRWRDIAAGREARVRTIFLDRGYDERRPDPPADFTTHDLQGAVSWIMNEGTHASQ